MNITETIYAHNDQLRTISMAVDELLAHMRGPAPESPSLAPSTKGQSALLGDLEATGKKISDLQQKLSELANLILSAAVLGKQAQVAPRYN